MVNKIYVKQIKSPIRRPEVQKKILRGLGLNKMNKISELNDTPSIRGMINKIPHLVQIIEKS
tara:strand:+ start:728 stop:913 length:186 start_codon:yes stop_codon:yes gene_type:complete